MPYVWGGGHGSFESSGYDCSGAVSYALHGGGFLSSPLDSTGLSYWGEAGAGQLDHRLRQLRPRLRRDRRPALGHLRHRRLRPELEHRASTATSTLPPTPPGTRPASEPAQREGSNPRRRRELETTKTLERAIAAPATIGFSSPVTASGSAATL